MVYQSEDLDATFSALADPTRREILSRLATGERSIKELASRFDMTLPAVSKHIRVLERAGLARIEQHGRVRLATLRATPMRRALEWLQHYRRFWQTELDLLAAYLEDTPTPQPEPSWPKQPPQRRPPSRSAGSSARRGSASSTRGRKRTS
jgi:DNA-binding transcriptional ArsR family regulator